MRGKPASTNAHVQQNGARSIAVYNDVPRTTWSRRPPSFDGNNLLHRPRNVVTITGAPVTLPASPARYYLGVLIGPNNQIKQINQVPNYTLMNPFTLAGNVGPYIPGLPAAGVEVAGGGERAGLPVPVRRQARGRLAGGGGLPRSPNAVVTLIRNNIAISAASPPVQPSGGNHGLLFRTPRPW
ncbi:MAG: hypothetical protein U0835_05540 [Isosphaeraceae bacterium]